MGALVTVTQNAKLAIPLRDWPILACVLHGTSAGPYKALVATAS